MPGNNDRGYNDRDDESRYEDRDHAPRRHDGPYARDRGFGHAPAIGPTGMVSQSLTGSFGTSGRYFEDADARAAYGGYVGGSPGYAAGPGERERGGRGRERGADTRLGNSYDPPMYRTDEYGADERRRPDETHLPRQGYRGYRADERDREQEWRARHEQVSREPRSWGEKAADEVRTWFGDPDAERRRDWDAAQGGHRGRGPKGYKRSDERIREDVSDRLTDDPTLDASEMEVTVSGGEVTLSGRVAGRYGKRRAEDVAESVSGVSHVQNNLRIRETPQPGSVGAQTDPLVSAVSEGHDADDTARELHDGPHAPN